MQGMPQPPWAPLVVQARPYRLVGIVSRPGLRRISRQRRSPWWFPGWANEPFQDGCRPRRRVEERIEARGLSGFRGLRERGSLCGERRRWSFRVRYRSRGRWSGVSCAAGAGGPACARRRRGDGRAGAAKAKSVAEVVPAEWIRQGHAVAFCQCRVIRLKGLVEDPSPDKPPQNPVQVVGQAGQHDKDDEVDDALGILAVVHRAHTGNEAQKAGQHGIRFPRTGRRCREEVGGRRADRSVAAGGRARCVALEGRTVPKGAGFAEDAGVDRTHGAGRKTPAALLTKGHGGLSGVRRSALGGDRGNRGNRGDRSWVVTLVRHAVALLCRALPIRER